MLLYYDLVITFPDEVKCIWQRNLTGATVLFLINRYASLIVQTFQTFTELHMWQDQTEQNANMVCLFIFSSTHY